MTTSTDLLASDFSTLSDLVHAHAIEQPQSIAIIDPDRSVTYAELDQMIDTIGGALQHAGVDPHDVVALCGPSSVQYLAIFIAALRIGAAACPLAPSSTADQLAAMVEDCGARQFFTTSDTAASLMSAHVPAGVELIALEGDGLISLNDWLSAHRQEIAPKAVDPEDAFNIIYSSGTTGTPKGIVQSHGMRWGHVNRANMLHYGPSSRTLASTPLYSNTTLVSVIPTLARGGTVILMRKFDAKQFLDLSQSHRVTHAMLVPVQYRRLMDVETFDSYDLSSYQMKTCTSAPFAADLKADILKRWPGGLVEIYGMTEGGGTCTLAAHEFPDKLHTVGRPAEGHDIRIIDENGKELPHGETGEVVGRSRSMMTGYYNQPEKTSAAEWFSPEGERFIRTGDVGRFDEDGFMVLGDRKKDMIISGGFNIYPSDLEAVVVAHPAVRECAVVGIESREWGETPAAYVVLRDGASVAEDELQTWANAKLGKMQRIRHIAFIDSLPRSAIGKVLKRELRDRFENEKR